MIPHYFLVDYVMKLVVNTNAKCS